MTEQARRGPYVGLVPYLEEDWEFFFGREAETELIVANLIAARLTVLYGASGVGKSSVLRAGVAHELANQARRNKARTGRPEVAIVVFSTWRDEPMAALAQAVAEGVAGVLGRDPASLARHEHWVETFGAWAGLVGGEILIVLDQFEEYFLYHPNTSGDGTFASEFPRLVNSPGLRVNFLLGIREDALACLDRFKGAIPNLFANYLRLRHMDREAAEAAIRRPLAKYNERHPDAAVDIEDELVSQVLQETDSERARPGAGSGTVLSSGEAESRGAQIETPYLQMVMTRLWEKEERPGARTLRLATLVGDPPGGLGGVDRIVRTHLDEKMARLDSDEQQVAAQAFRFLVTRTGTKISLAVDDLAEHTELPAARLEPVLQKLAAGERRILRTVPVAGRSGLTCYEIYHDVLGPAVIDWRRRYEAFREVEEVRREQEQRRMEELRAAEAKRQQERSAFLKLGVWVLSVGLILLGGFAWFAIQQRDRALEEAKNAQDARKFAQAEADKARFALEQAQQATREAETTARASISARAAEASREHPEANASTVGTELRDAFLRGDNAVIDVTARRLGRLNERVRFMAERSSQNYEIRQGRVYEFSMRPVAETVEGGLQSLAAVSFKMNHPTFRNRVIAGDPQRGFRAGYVGWGCLSMVPVLLEYLDPGRLPDIALFDMCDSLPWLSVSATSNPRVVRPGGSTEIMVSVKDKTGTAVPGAQVVVSAGGGVFEATGGTSVTGITDGQGVFRTPWRTYQASAPRYQLNVQARKEGVGEAHTEVEVVVGVARR